MSYPNEELVDTIAKALAANDRLNWDEQCAYEADEEADECDSSTCVAAHYEDHDPHWARSHYRSMAKSALLAHGMSFKTLREANLSRCARWHPRGLSEWSLSDWGVATAGEMGEALNVVKKLNRERDGIAGNTASIDELRSQLADEIADVAIYLDIMAASEGIDLAQAIASKFNRTSEKVGFPERL